MEIFILLENGLKPRDLNANVNLVGGVTGLDR